MNSPKISMIAAIGVNRELGEGRRLIWKISRDLRRFRKLTEGHAIIMGRKTYESIGRLLPNRTNIIISRDPNFKVEGALVVSSIEKALDEARRVEKEEAFIIGGGQVYTLAMPFADKLYLTKINSEAPLADVFFPDYSDFKKVVYSEKNIEDSLEYEFVDLEK